MKTLLLLFLGFSLTIYAQDQQNKESAFVEYVNIFLGNNPNSPIENNFLLYRAQNMFEVRYLNEEKINQYEVLNAIEYRNHPSEELKTISPEEFITLFNNNQINTLLLNIKRDRQIEKWYRLGNTNYVLIGIPEEKLVNNFSSTK